MARVRAAARRGECEAAAEVAVRGADGTDRLTSPRVRPQEVA
jgi:hypothetical protein